MASKTIDSEYRRIFNFLLIFKAASIAYALATFYVAKQPITPLIMTVLVIITVYTTLFIVFRNRVFDLLINKPFFYSIDIIIAVFALLSAIKPSIPFYNFSAASIVTATMLFRLRADLWIATILSLAQIGSALINGLPISSSSGGVAMLLGEIFAYYIIALFGNYISRLVKEVFAQRKIIKTQAEQQAVQEERQRIAREMHDNIAQILAGIKFRTEALRDSVNPELADDAKSILDATKEGLQAVREAIFSLREDMFESPLAEIFTRYCRELTANIGFKVQTEFSGEPPLSQATKAELFRIYQEAINNANKHSGQGEVSLSLCISNGNFQAKIRDNGAGFDTELPGNGLGLKSMQERASKIGASLEIDSQPGEGTSICCSVPILSISEN